MWVVKCVFVQHKDSPPSLNLIILSSDGGRFNIDSNTNAQFLFILLEHCTSEHLLNVKQKLELVTVVVLVLLLTQV